MFQTIAKTSIPVVSETVEMATAMAEATSVEVPIPTVLVVLVVVIVVIVIALPRLVALLLRSAVSSPHVFPLWISMPGMHIYFETKRVQIVVTQSRCPSTWTQLISRMISLTSARSIHSLAMVQDEMLHVS